MEHNFEPKSISCLQWEIFNSKNQEQVLEVRLPDGFPDIGNIIGSWGQCILREKEWRGGKISVNGCVMAQVLYHPLDADEPQCIEALLPFRENWEIEDRKGEGSLRVHCYLKSVDARMLSERKMMIRAAFAICIEALMPVEVRSYLPGSLPEDVQLLRREYPMMLPTMASEKNILLDEDVTAQGIERVISCSVVPKMIRQQLVGDKLSMVGIAQCHLLYSQNDGALRMQDTEIEFSQVEDVGKEYGSEAYASVVPALYSLECEKMEGKVRLRCGIACQYLIMDHTSLEIIEDAYSPVREVAVHEEELLLPAVLDIKNQSLQANTMVNIPCNQMIESNLMMDSPLIQRSGDVIKVLLDGTVQVLYKDGTGQLQCGNGKWGVQMQLDAAHSVDVVCSPPSIKIEEIKTDGTGADVLVDISMQILSVSGQDMPMLTGMNIGEIIQPDPARPSLLIKRKGDESIWELAKFNGSTVEAIYHANKWNENITDSSMLLIPVL